MRRSTNSNWLKEQILKKGLDRYMAATMLAGVLAALATQLI